MARRPKNCIDPISAAALVTGAFAVGILAERSVKVSHKAEAEARKQARRGKAAASAEIEKRTRSARKAIDVKTRGFREAIGITPVKTHAKWTLSRSHPDDPPGAKEYTRNINGNRYVVWDNPENDGPSVSASRGNKYWAVGDDYSSVTAAKKAAEKDAKSTKPRKNTSQKSSGTTYREEVLDAFFDHSRISPGAVKSGALGLVGYVYQDKQAYEDAEAPDGPFDLKTSAFWARIRPGYVVEIFVYDPSDENAELSDKDMLAVEVTGTTRKDRASIRDYEDDQYGRQSRSHKGNRCRKGHK